MYISEITLKNVRCFEKKKITINRRGGSLVIAGDNGDGKTAILRAIAMGLCDESSAAGLLRELPGQFVRVGQPNCATINLSLREDRGDRIFYTLTEIKKLKRFEQISQVVKQQNGTLQKLDQNNFPWEEIFVCGYGAGRPASGTADLERYRAVDAVYTLFRYYEPLQNAELALRRLVEEARRRHGGPHARRVKAGLLDMLRNLLNLEERVSLRDSGITIHRSWGECDLRSCGDGYGALTTLVLDIISWRMLTKRPFLPAQMSGIVLIDEIEQHLHPIWQRNIMRLLVNAFPRVQFIVTTHSPIVLSGCKDFQLLNLSRRGKQDVPTVYGWRAEDVYRAMGVPSSRPEEIANLLRLFERLHLKTLTGRITERERSALRRVEASFKGIPDLDVKLATTKMKNIGLMINRSHHD